MLTVLGEPRLSELRQLFSSVEYRVEPVLNALGPSAHAALGRNQTVPALRALAERDDPLADLIRLWPLQATISARAARAALPTLLQPLVDAGVLDCDGEQVWARIDCRPYAGDDGVDGWVFSDLTPGLDTRPIRVGPDYVLGVSPASSSLAQLTVRRPVASALDLGAGCGVQSLHLARHAERVVATDLNPRALLMAEMTAVINQLDLDLRGGDLYGPVGEETFDLIVTNPPYVMSPPTGAGQRLTYREAGLPGDELVRRVVVEGAARLAPGGVLQVLGNWAQRRGADWGERPQRWVEQTGCDAHVVRREDLDAAEYAEIWLADAGLAGTGEYAQAFAGWLDYFDALGIDSVGMGWLTLVNAGRDDPAVTVEDWPYAIEQPIGPALADRMSAVERDRSMSDAEVITTAWTLAEDVVAESLGRPGEADPQTIVLRQQRGFRRAEQVDTALAGVIGACDGDLRLDQVLAAVASIMDVEPEPLRAEIVPRVRQMVLNGMLWP